MYASRAINVLITVIFRVFFDDDNELTHFFVDVNPKSANSSKLAKLRKTPKFRIFRNFTDFEIFALLGLKKKLNIFSYTAKWTHLKSNFETKNQFHVIFQETDHGVVSRFDEMAMSLRHT